MKTVTAAAAVHRRMRWRVAGAILFCMALAGCTLQPPPPPSQWAIVRAPVIPPMGLLYTHFHAPLLLPGDADLGDLKSPPKGPAVYVRLPMPFATGPVGLEFALGRVDLESAARRAGIERLVYADYEFRSILGYFKTMKIYAHGFGSADSGTSGDAKLPGTP